MTQLRGLLYYESLVFLRLCVNTVLSGAEESRLCTHVILQTVQQLHRPTGALKVVRTRRYGINQSTLQTQCGLVKTPET